MVLDSNSRTTWVLPPCCDDVSTLSFEWTIDHLPTTHTQISVSTMIWMSQGGYLSRPGTRDQSVARWGQSCDSTNRFQWRHYGSFCTSLGHQFRFSGSDYLVTPWHPSPYLPMQSETDWWHFYRPTTSITSCRRVLQFWWCNPKRPLSTLAGLTPTRNLPNASTGPHQTECSKI